MVSLFRKGSSPTLSETIAGCPIHDSPTVMGGAPGDTVLSHETGCSRHTQAIVTDASLPIRYKTCHLH